MTARTGTRARKPAKGQPTKGQVAKERVATPMLARQGVAMAVSGVIGAATGAMAGLGASRLGKPGGQHKPKGFDVSSMAAFSKQAWAGFGRRMVGAPVGDAAETGGAADRVSRPKPGQAGSSAALAGPSFPPAGLTAGAARGFLLARVKAKGWARGKAPYELSLETGVDAETLRKAMRPDAYELSARNFSRLVAAYGPGFLAAVIDPVPAWVNAALAPPPVAPALPIVLSVLDEVSA
jgi:hypothetical protein